MPPEADTIEKPAAAAPADKPAAAAVTPAPADKPAVAAPAADKQVTPSPVEKPAVAAKPTVGFLDDVEDDDDEPAAAPAAKTGDDEGSAEGEGDKKPAGADWPDDWRTKFAAGDEKLAKRLERFASPQNIIKSWLAAEQKIRSGDYKKTLGEDATPEEVAAWREDNGIPDSPDKYELPQIPLGEADKPLVGSFLAKLHSVNTPAPIAKAAIEWYGEFQQQQIEARAEADREAATQLDDKYRAEWGGDYKANMNILRRALKDPDIMPGGLGSAMVDARMADGTLLRHHPAFFAAFAQLARQQYGEAALLPADTIAAINGREEELVRMMKTDYNTYMSAKNAKGQLLTDELTEIRRQKAGNKR